MSTFSSLDLIVLLKVTCEGEMSYQYQLVYLYIDVSRLQLLCEMTTKNCGNGPKLVLKDLCEKSFVRNVLYSYPKFTFMRKAQDYFCPLKSY